MSRESSLLMDDDVIKQRLFQRRKDILEFRAATDESRRPVEVD